MIHWLDCTAPLPFPRCTPLWSASITSGLPGSGQPEIHPDRRRSGNDTGSMPRRRPLWSSTARRLLRDLVTFVRLGLTSRARLAAENLFLRKQLALYQERHTKPRRPDPATRVALVLLARLLDWRSLLTVVQPDTLIRWHRQGWRLFWRWKARPGRPPIPADLQRLIVTIARANPTWGEERIANELLLKLGLAVSPRTIGRYLRPVRSPRGGRPSQRWATFVRNHATAVLACDFFTTVTAGSVSSMSLWFSTSVRDGSSIGI